MNRVDGIENLIWYSDQNWGFYTLVASKMDIFRRYVRTGRHTALRKVTDLVNTYAVVKFDSGLYAVVKFDSGLSALTSSWSPTRSWNRWNH